MSNTMVNGDLFLGQDNVEVLFLHQTEVEYSDLQSIVGPSRNCDGCQQFKLKYANES